MKSAHMQNESSDPFRNLKHDIPAGLVVFLVALPLCLGIALASEAPLLSGVAAGILGGLLIPLISRSPLSVSGPAAGLTAIVTAGITELGSFEAFLAATAIAGILQMALGFLRAGGLGALVPSSVIKGMLAAIGLILIGKQLPVTVGHTADKFGWSTFFDLTVLGELITNIKPGAVIIAVVSLAIIIIWPRTPMRKLVWLPAALVVVVTGTFLNIAFGTWAPDMQLKTTLLVSLPAIEGPTSLWAALPTPDFSSVSMATLRVAVTIALVASVETLLCVEAVDGMDPLRRVSPTSRELVAQGTANLTAGFIGALPLTSVIVRSSANIASGGRTRASAFIHGLFLIITVMFFAQYLSMIPLACLAAILLQVGYKLVQPKFVKSLYHRGTEKIVPFVVTVVAILITDLLIGVIVGLVVGLVFVLRNKTHRAFTLTHEGEHYDVRINKDLSFIHVPALMQILREIPDGAKVRIDAQDIEYVDFDIQERLEDFLKSAEIRKLEVEVRNLNLHTEAPATPRKKVQTVVRGSGVPESMVTSRKASSTEENPNEGSATKDGDKASGVLPSPT